MTPIILGSFTIPAVTVFVLIVLLIEERNYLFPKKTNTNAGVNANIEQEQNQADYRRDRYGQGKRYPDDFLDFSGGTMGI
jgi:hypothetical protein